MLTGLVGFVKEDKLTRSEEDVQREQGEQRETYSMGGTVKQAKMTGK